MDNDVKTEFAEPVEQTTEKSIAPDWTESEWFEVWLKLARREYHAADP